MGTYLFSGEVVKVDASGNYSVSEMRADTDSISFTSGTIGTEIFVDGTSLGPDAPTFFYGNGANNATVTLSDGKTVSAAFVTFSDGTNDYYMFQPTAGSSIPSSGQIDANRVTDIDFGTLTEMQSNELYNYSKFHLIDEDSKIRSGDALVATGSYLSVATVFSTDDDPRFEFAASETGKTPVIYSSASRVTPLSLYYEFNGTSGTEPNLVTVSYTTTTGTGSFDAIKFTLYSTSHYFPINGHDDLSTITAITGEVDSGIPVDGQTYAAFGLSKNQIDVTGTSADDMLIGDISNDKLSGLAGNDVMFGDIGEDKMLGAGGKDKMYGGAGNDEMLGGGGGDTMHGGIGDDTLDGGGAKDKMWGDAGDDVIDGKKGVDTLRGGDGDDILNGGNHGDILYGGRNNDTLDGGNGHDTLSGDQGADTLDGGDGSDVLTGGIGADVFVFTADGETDTITDYADGQDRIDLDVGFNKLTITDVAPGEVHITHSGETLIVLDGGLGLLTAADFTRDDFI